MKPFRLFTTDILIVDRVLDYVKLTGEQRQAVDRIMSKYGMALEGKKPLNKQQLEALTAEIVEAVGGDEEKAFRNMPGGSSANTVTTMARILGKEMLEVVFMGVTGNDKFGKMIRDEMAAAGVNLIPDKLPEGSPEPESAVSIVIVKGGKRAIATYPGNAGQIIKSHLITDEIMANCDAVLEQGGLCFKYGETIPANGSHAPRDNLSVVDQLNTLRRQHGKELWLALPTQSDFSKLNDINGKKMDVDPDDKTAYYRKLIPSANIIFGNGEELSRVYTTKEERKEITDIVEQATTAVKERFKEENPGSELLESELFARVREYIKTEKGEEGLANLESRFNIFNKSIHAAEAVKRLNDALRSNPLEAMIRDEGWKLKNGRQAAFITLGEDGAAIVTTNRPVQYIKPAHIEKDEIISTLGAGDSFYGGASAAYVMQQKQEALNPQDDQFMLNASDAGYLGAWMAREKLKYDGSRVLDPRARLTTMLDQAYSAGSYREEDGGEAFVRKMQGVFATLRDVNEGPQWQSRTWRGTPGTVGSILL